MNLHYSFRARTGRKGDRRVHLLRYVLRDPTIKVEKHTVKQHPDMLSDDDLVLLYHGLRGFKRVRWYGELSDAPICSAKLEWSMPEEGELREPEWRELRPGSGLWADARTYRAYQDREALTAFLNEVPDG